MRTNIIFSVLLYFLIGVRADAKQADIVNDLNGWLKSSNSREIAKHFASTVELNILNDEDVYSKVQAEIILKDFFSKHQPESSRVIHKLDSNPNYRFAVIELDTENGKFRTTISLKDTGGRFLITEMRIEFDKE